MKLENRFFCSIRLFGKALFPPINHCFGPVFGLLLKNAEFTLTALEQEVLFLKIITRARAVDLGAHDFLSKFLKFDSTALVEIFKRESGMDVSPLIHPCSE